MTPTKASAPTAMPTRTNAPSKRPSSSLSASVGSKDSATGGFSTATSCRNTKTHHASQNGGGWYRGDHLSGTTRIWGKSKIWCAKSATNKNRIIMGICAFDPGWPCRSNAQIPIIIRFLDADLAHQIFDFFQTQVAPLKWPPPPSS